METKCDRNRVERKRFRYPTRYSNDDLRINFINFVNLNAKNYIQENENGDFKMYS